MSSSINNNTPKYISLFSDAKQSIVNKENVALKCLLFVGLAFTSSFILVADLINRVSYYSHKKTLVDAKMTKCLRRLFLRDDEIEMRKKLNTFESTYFDTTELRNMKKYNANTNKALISTLTAKTKEEVKGLKEDEQSAYFTALGTAIENTTDEGQKARLIETLIAWKKDEAKGLKELGRSAYFTALGKAIENATGDQKAELINKL